MAIGSGPKTNEGLPRPNTPEESGSLVKPDNEPNFQNHESSPNPLPPADNRPNIEVTQIVDKQSIERTLRKIQIIEALIQQQGHRLSPEVTESINMAKNRLSMAEINAISAENLEALKRQMDEIAKSADVAEIADKMVEQEQELTEQLNQGQINTKADAQAAINDQIEKSKEIFEELEKKQKPKKLIARIKVFITRNLALLVLKFNKDWSNADKLEYLIQNGFDENEAKAILKLHEKDLQEAETTDLAQVDIIEESDEKEQEELGPEIEVTEEVLEDTEESEVTVEQDDAVELAEAEKVTEDPFKDIEQAEKDADFDKLAHIRKQALEKLRGTLEENLDNPSRRTASARVKDANEQLFTEMMTETVFDPANLAVVGTVDFTKLNDLQTQELNDIETELEAGDPKAAIRKRLERTYGEYFTTEDDRQILFPQTGETDLSEQKGYHRRVLAEMQATEKMLLDRNDRSYDIMKTYYEAITGNSFDMELTDETRTEYTRALAEFSKTAIENLNSSPNKEALIKDAETAVKLKIIQELFADNPNLHPQAKELLGAQLEKFAANENIQIRLTLAGPVLTMDQETLVEFMNTYSGEDLMQDKNEGLEIRGAVINDVVLATDGANMHELGHNIFNSLRRQRQDAAADILANNLVKQYERKTNTQINETHRQELLIQARNFLTEQGNSSQVDTDFSQFIENPRTSRSELFKNVYKDMGEVDTVEEIGASLMNLDVKYMGRLNFALVGVDPEKFSDTNLKQEVISESDLVAGTLLGTLNQLQDLSAQYKLAGDPRGDLYDRQKRLLAMAIERRGKMSIGEMYRFFDKLKTHPQFQELFAEIDLPTLSRTNDTEVALTDRAAILNKILAYKDQLNPQDIHLYNQVLLKFMAGSDFGKITAEDFELSNETLTTLADITKEDQTSIDLLLGNKGDFMQVKGVMFSTGYTGGSYSSHMRKFLEADYNPGMVRDRGKVNMANAFFGSNASIQEDSRGTAMFLLRGLWNPADILGMTPYKMNEAYGAWAVRLLGKPIAGFFGFHAALGANPIEKGIPGGLGKLPIFKDLAKTLKISPYEIEVDGRRVNALNRLASPRIVDTVKQHSDSIFLELAKYGKNQAEIMLIMEAIGGFRQEQTGFTNSTKSFHDFDEHRMNPAFLHFYENDNANISNPSIQRLLGEDRINGTRIVAINNTLHVNANGQEDQYKPMLYLRKGQMSDNLLTELVSTVLNSNQEERERQQDLFKSIGKAMMTVDLSTIEASRGRDFFTIKELIERVNRMENHVNPANREYDGIDGRANWPIVQVNIGTKDNPQLFDIDAVKDFVRHFYKAKAKIVLDAGIYGTVPNANSIMPPDTYDNLTPEQKALLQKDGYLHLPNRTIDPMGLVTYNPVIVKVGGEQIVNNQRVPILYEVKYSQDAFIEKQGPQGLPIKYDPVLAATEEDINFLIGNYAEEDGRVYLKSVGTVTENIDDEADAKQLALEQYFEFQKRVKQTQEFAEMAKMKKKLWAGLAKFNKVFRWAVWTGVIAGFAVPGLAPIFLTPLMAKSIVGVFFFDWIFSRFIDRSRDGWGARAGIAEETAMKVEGMRNVFEQARTGAALGSDQLQTLRVYTGTIEKMWEDLMPSYDKVVKYKENLTQRLSTDFWDIGKMWVQSNANS